MGENRPFPQLITISLILLVVLLGGSLVVLFITRSAVQKEKTKKIPVKEEQSESLLGGERSIYLDLPANFPKDVPLMKKVKVTAAEESDTSFTAVFSTESSPSDVRGFYEGEFEKTGFTITNQSQGAGISIYYVSKGPREAVITIGRGESSTTISITVVK